jgi:hypothetical protein
MGTNSTEPYWFIEEQSETESKFKDNFSVVDNIPFTGTMMSFCHSNTCLKVRDRLSLNTSDAQYRADYFSPLQKASTI